MLSWMVVWKEVIGLGESFVVEGKEISSPQAPERNGRFIGSLSVV